MPRSGAPIQYTITIPSTVKNEAGAEAFVQFVLSKRVRSVSHAHGLLPFKVKVVGDSRMALWALLGMICALSLVGIERLIGTLSAGRGVTR